jgi:hypothetical protein
MSLLPHQRAVALDLATTFEPLFRCVRCEEDFSGEADLPAGDLRRVRVEPDPTMLKADRNGSKMFAQLVITIRYGSKSLATP